MSDEEKKAIKEVKHFKELTRYWQEEEYEEKEIAGYIATVLNLIEKQSKEIEEAEQKERKAYIDGTNVAHELCNKKWEDKIKAKIEEQDETKQYWTDEVKDILKSLLEKE